MDVKSLRELLKKASPSLHKDVEEKYPLTEKVVADSWQTVLPTLPKKSKDISSIEKDYDEESAEGFNDWLISQDKY